VRATGIGSRLSVFLAFAALAAGMGTLLLPGTPAPSPSPTELESRENKLFSGASLHHQAGVQEPIGSAEFCVECHPAPPHPGRRVADALANQHAARMDCLLCHWSAAGGPRPRPAWQVPTGAPAFLAVLPLGGTDRPGLEKLRSAASVGRRCFERGPTCEGCHRPGGIGPLAQPGTSPTRTAALERLENIFLLEPGEKWYLPQLQ
jgi:hypothetical protein